MDERPQLARLFVDYGCQLQIDITKAGKAQTVGSSVSPSGLKYEVCVEEIDELVAAIFRSSKINPSAFFTWIQPDAKTMMYRDNRSFEA